MKVYTATNMMGELYDNAHSCGQAYASNYAHNQQTTDHADDFHGKAPIQRIQAW